MPMAPVFWPACRPALVMVVFSTTVELGCTRTPAGLTDNQFPPLKTPGPAIMLIGYELGFVTWIFCVTPMDPNGRLIVRDVGFAVGLITTVGVTLSVTGMRKVAPVDVSISTVPDNVWPACRRTVLTEIFSGVVL